MLGQVTPAYERQLQVQVQRLVNEVCPTGYTLQAIGPTSGMGPTTGLSVSTGSNIASPQTQPMCFPSNTANAPVSPVNTCPTGYVPVTVPGGQGVVATPTTQCVPASQNTTDPISMIESSLASLGGLEWPILIGGAALVLFLLFKK